MTIDAPSRPRVSMPPVDPRLPSLTRLLDAESATETLARAFRLEPREVRVAAVRYKPRRRLVVEYDVGIDGTTSRFVALLDAKGDLARLAAPPSITWDAWAGCLLQRWPKDAALPALSLLVEDTEIERLGYKPFTRATLRRGRDVLKLYASEKKWRRAADALERVTHAGLSAARLVRIEPETRATVQRFVAGGAPNVLGAAPSAGALLRQLHALDAGGLTPVGPEDRLVESARTATLVATIVPELATRVEALCAELGRALPISGRPVTAHGDFEPGQLIAGDELTLVDVDDLCAAPCADDLGRYAAHAVRGNDRDLGAAQEVLAALVAGYCRRPDGVTWYTAAAILARAAAPFRRQLPDWPRRVEAFVAAAERMVAV